MYQTDISPVFLDKIVRAFTETRWIRQSACEIANTLLCLLWIQRPIIKPNPSQKRRLFADSGHRGALEIIGTTATAYPGQAVSAWVLSQKWYRYNGCFIYIYREHNGCFIYIYRKYNECFIYIYRKHNECFIYIYRNGYRCCIYIYRKNKLCNSKLVYWSIYNGKNCLIGHVVYYKYLPD